MTGGANASRRVPRALPVLYSFRRCPFAMRARLALKYAQIDVAVREVVLRDKPLALIACSPKATVPVLALPDGSVLDESFDIMRWALAQHDPDMWMRSEEAVETAALIVCNDGPFKRLLDQYKYPERYTDAPSAAACRDEAAALVLDPLAQRLTSHRFLLRETLSMADMAIVPFIRQFAAVDPVWFEDTASVALQRWLHELVDGQLFQSVMQKRPAWRSGDADVML